MDLRLHANVIWRWRFIVISGLMLAMVLMFLSFFRVSLAEGFSLHYRQGKTWRSTETLLLTQQDCALGQVTCRSQGFLSSPGIGSSVAPLYAQFANSGLIRARVLPNGQATAATGDYLASPVTDASTGGQQLLPFLQFDGTGSTPGQATRMARRAVSVFLKYLSDTSNSSKIPQSNRIVLQVVSPATLDDAQVFADRKKTRPIVVFLAVMIVTLGLAYVLENLFPSRRRAAVAEPRIESVVDSEHGLEPTLEPVQSTEPSGPRAAAGAEATRRK